jgi:SAM-dependent methyltransferase
MPDEQVLTAVFDDGYFTGGGARGGYDDYDADAATHRANARHRLAGLPQRRGPVDTGQPPPRLVDVGCASGYTLEAARERGWDAIGVEVSPAAAAAARAKGFRVEPTLQDLQDPQDGDGVDAVCFFQVLEHLPDPVAALRTAAALLRPDGLVLIETWDGASRVARLSGSRWQQLSPPSVLWVFDEPSLRALTARAGLSLTGWQRTSKLVSVGLVVGQLAPRLPGPMAGAARRVAGRAGGIRLRYGLGDLVAASAVRSSRRQISSTISAQAPPSA